MKKIQFQLKSALAIMLVAFCMFSCSKSPEHAKYIPKDANIVLAMDVKSIGIKSMDFKEIFSLENLKKTLNGAKDSSMEKLKNSGIDLLNTAYVFGQISEDSKNYAGMTVSISDAAKFETFVKDLGKYTVSKEGEYSIASKSAESRDVIAWSKNAAIFLFENRSGVSGKEKALSLLNIKKEESLIENDKNFQSLQKESADISLWMNFEKLGKLASTFNPAAGGINFKETYLNATCNFEKGQIVIDTKYFTNKETAEKLTLTKESLSDEIAKALPGKSVAAMVGLSFDMDKLHAYLTKENVLATAEEQAKMTTGLTTKELFNMLTGEVAGTVNGVVMKDVESMDWMTGEKVMRKEPRPEYAVVIGIKDKEKSAKLLSTFVEKGMLQKTGDYYSVMNQAFIVDKGSYLIVTGTEGMRQASIDGSGDKLSSELSDLLTKNSGSVYISIKDIPDTFLELTLGNKGKDRLRNSQLESITLSNSQIKDNMSEGKLVIAFSAKDENSLITLAKVSESYAKEEKEREEARKAEFEKMMQSSTMDSVAVPVEPMP